MQGMQQGMQVRKKMNDDLIPLSLFSNRINMVIMVPLLSLAPLVLNLPHIPTNNNSNP